METQAHQSGNQQKNKLLPSEIYYNTSDLSRLKYIKIVYTGVDGKLHEVTKPMLNLSVMYLFLCILSGNQILI